MKDRAAAASHNMLKNWRPPALLATATVLLLAAWPAFAVISWWLGSVTYPANIDWMEPVLLLKIRQVAAGHALYVVEPDSFFAAVYGPLYYYGSAFVTAHQPYEYTVLRAGAVFFTFVAMLGAGIAAWRSSGQLIAAAFPFVLLPLTDSLAQFASSIKPDSAALALTATGIAVLYIFDRNKRHTLVLAALCFAAAFFTKQSYVAAPLALFITLKKEQRWFFAGVYGTLVLSGVALCFALFGRDFYTHQVVYNAVGFNWDFAINVAWPRYAKSNWPFWLFAACGLYLKPSRFFLAYALTTALGLLIMAKAGSNINHWNESLFAAVLAGSPGLARLARWPEGRRIEAAVVFAVVVYLAIYAAPSMPTPRELEIAARIDRSNQSRLRDVFADQPVRVFSAAPDAVARLPGVQLPIADAFTYRTLVERGILRGVLFRSMIRTQSFDYAFVNNSETLRYRMNAAQRELLFQHYQTRETLPGTLFTEGDLLLMWPRQVVP